MTTRLIVNLLVICLVTITTAQNSTSEPNFSFEKLAEYTSLASCFAKIHEDFVHCNKKAEEKAKSLLEHADENSDLAKRVKCCGTWELRDCWVTAAKDKCESKHVEQVYNLPQIFMPNLEKLCTDYPSGSSKCSTN